MRGVSLDDIAEATKIGTRSLRALEEEHFELLPGGIFNKGFVRAYAKYLGLNEDEAVADYLAAAGESSPDPRVIAEQNAGRIDRIGGEAGDHRRPGFPIVPVLILLLVIAAGAGGWQLYQQRVRDRQAREDAARATAANTSPPSSTTSELVNPAGSSPSSGQPRPNPADTITTNPAAAPATTPGNQSPSTTKTPEDLNSQVKTIEAAGNPSEATLPEGTKPKPPLSAAQTLSSTIENAPKGPEFEVTVRAKDRAWVSIKSDGKYTVRGIISPNDVKTVHATDQIVFYTGNAGAVEISFNGQRVPLEGGPNTEGVLVFNSRGVVIPRPAVATQP
jgi:cytoskeletal protein RodZ